jgi:hypothetical protein
MATLNGLWLDWMRRRDRQAVDHALTVIEDLIRTEGKRDEA